VEVDRVLVAILGVLGQRLQDDALELVGDLAVVGRRREDLDVADLLERREVALADEQPLAGQQLVQHDAAREDVALAIDRQAAHLLGRHVAELALEDAGLGLLALARRLGDAEVDQLHLALEGDEDVLRADVAVDQVEVAAALVALVVRVVQALADLHDHEAGLGHRHRLVDRAAPVEDVPEIATVDVLQRDVVRAVDDTEVEDLGDVRVVQLNRDLRLVDEHLDELFVLRDVRKDPLHGHQPLEALHPVGLRPEDLGHAADIDALEQVVLAEWNGLLHGADQPARERPPPSVGPYTN
jgi:hypothetical protein